MARFSSSFGWLAPIAIAGLTLCGLTVPVTAAKRLTESDREKALRAQISRTTDMAVRAQLLTDFTLTFPSSPWTRDAFGQLLDIYLQRQAWEKAIVVGQKLLTLNPSSFQAAQSCLKAAEGLGSFDLIEKYAVETWYRSAWAIKGNQAGAAREAQVYAERALSVASAKQSDPGQRKRAGATLARLNPNSQFLQGAGNKSAEAADRSITTPAPRASVAAPTAAAQATTGENEDYLIAEAERYLHLGQNYAKVLDDSERALTVLRAKQEPPAGQSAEDWSKKRERNISLAYWMSGMAATMLGRYDMADRNLRAALPSIQNKPEALGVTLYSLGYVNYRLAASGDGKRIFEALKFNEQCASVAGPYREEALKNNEAIRAHYRIHE